MKTVKFDYSIGDSVIIKSIDMPGTVESLLMERHGKSYRVIY